MGLSQDEMFLFAAIVFVVGVIVLGAVVGLQVVTPVNEFIHLLGTR